MAAKTYEGKSLRLGGGGRFERMVDAIVRERGISRDRAKAIAAAVGRKKYGKKKFQQMAAAGRRRAAKKKRSSRRRRLTL